MPSIYRVDPSDVETFTIVTNPIRTYTSSSTTGVTGSVYVFARRSPTMKDASPDSSFVETRHDDGDYATLLQTVQSQGQTQRAVTGSFNGLMEQYMAAVDAKGQQRRLQQSLDVVRFTPPAVLNSNTLRKLIVKDTLQIYYRTAYPTAHWAYSNYNCLNFFTASAVTTGSALLYPNIEAGSGGLANNLGHVSGVYVPSGAFSFDFYLNPRYQQDAPDGVFKAGTLFHLSSTYAVSLVTGSARDENGRALGFRLQLQLSHSADIPPSLAVPGTNRAGYAPGDLVFRSDDNSLQHNHWHHVVIRWGTDLVNHGTGTFNIDGVDRGTFNVPSSTIAPLAMDALDGPDVLVVGNYYEGKNTGTDGLAYFFANDPAKRDGLQQLVNDVGGTSTPGHFAFNHPLNAEVHDLAIRRCYLSDDDINFSSSRGPTYLDNTFAFYVPPFFVEQSPYRQFVGDHGGILVTPFEEVDGSTTTPFSVALSFGVGGHYINLENFVRDFASNVFPRLHELTASAITTSTSAETCNDFLYTQPFVTKRNLSILPCDDGLFVPSFQLLASETLARAVDDLGIEELSFIHLDDMVHTATLLFGGGAFDGDTSTTVSGFTDLQLGATPETPFAAAGPALVNYTRNVVSGSDVEFGAPLTVYQRTQDPSSNQVTFFDISNLFYGFRISPGTLRLQDPDMLRSSFKGSNVSITGVQGPVRLTLADDGRGNVYRADCLTSQSSWNSVGNVYYDEGLVVLKSPHAYFFGDEAYSLTFRGEQHIHVMKVDALAPNNQMNSSSNLSFVSVPVNGYPNDPEDDFVYVTGINFHDRDFNVVMKSQLAQPIAKRPGDRVLFRIKHDF